MQNISELRSIIRRLVVEARAGSAQPGVWMVADINGRVLSNRRRKTLTGAQKVADKPKAVVGATGKVVVGLAAPAQGKSKSALRREKTKQKKEEEDTRKALEVKVLVVEPTLTAPTAPAPENRARRIKKTLKQIDELKAKDPSSLNEDQKKKIDSEAELLQELASLDI